MVKYLAHTHPVRYLVHPETGSRTAGLGLPISTLHNCPGPANTPSPKGIQHNMSLMIAALQTVYVVRIWRHC